MDTITLHDLAVSFHVGVPDAERARSQRLLLTVELQADLSRAAATDDLKHTVDYFELVQAIKSFGAGREWRLIEKLAADIAEMILDRYSVTRVSVEVRKFIVSDCRFIAVRISRSRA
ncbi:MAG TPA: dihydroneopterin aldolase [Methylomirabilota bacterium]|nr:dihydroneopterin aldolase [Methylomirabilota bacterium]